MYGVSVPSNFLIFPSLGPLAASPRFRRQSIFSIQLKHWARGEGIEDVLRMKEVAKLRFTIGDTAARRATVIADRERNIVEGNWVVIRNGSSWM